MRKFLFNSIVFVGLLTGPAMAADLPVKAPIYETPAVAPVYNWTGFYVGVNGGGSWGRSNPDVVYDPSSRLAVATASGSNLTLGVPV
jgi:hypothetical protein